MRRGVGQSTAIQRLFVGGEAADGSILYATVGSELERLELVYKGERPWVSRTFSFDVVKQSVKMLGGSNRNLLQASVVAIDVQECSEETATHPVQLHALLRLHKAAEASG